MNELISEQENKQTCELCHKAIHEDCESFSVRFSDKRGDGSYTKLVCFGCYDKLLEYQFEAQGEADEE